jgi:hypothetical protein
MAVLLRIEGKGSYMKTLNEIKGAYRKLIKTQPSVEAALIGRVLVEEGENIKTAKGAAYFLEGVRWLERQIKSEANDD